MKKHKLYILALSMLALLAVISVTGGLFAKYMRSQSLNSNIKFSAGLTKDLKLTENAAEKQKDGSYILNEQETIENSYTVMPGVDIPKNPRVVVTEKSRVDAYLYIEAVGNCPAGVTYTLTNDWQPLENITGPNGGAVYIYSGADGTPAVLNENFSASPIQIISDDIITVSDSFSPTADFSLCFYGYMAQCQNNVSAETVFNSSFIK